MSVDDLIDTVVGYVEEQGLADNTYFLYSSDHGKKDDLSTPFQQTDVHLLAFLQGFSLGYLRSCTIDRLHALTSALCRNSTSSLTRDNTTIMTFEFTSVGYLNNISNSFA